MKHIHYEDWYWFNDYAWRVNARKSGLYTHILRPILSQFNNMLVKHSKVFVYRFDIRVAGYTEDNKVISDLIRRLKKRIKAHYRIGNISYCWVREQERSKHQHYHLVFLLDGQKVRHPYQLNKWIAAYSEFFDLKPYWAGYHNVRRDQADYEMKAQQACYHVSYLAKSRGKGYRSAYTQDYGVCRCTYSLVTK